MLDGIYLAIRRLAHRRYRSKLKSANGLRQWCMIRHPVMVTVGLGLLIALSIIVALELRLRPVVEKMSAHHVNNQITQVINSALLNYLSQNDNIYFDLVTIERGVDGSITALTSNMSEINRLRANLVDTALQALEKIDIYRLGIPIGNLFDLDILWAKGPLIHVRSLVSGTVQAEINSQFEEAGINQTRHRIMLDIHVPLTVMLPGCSATTKVATSVCVAETVIVGIVPDTYLKINETGVNAT